MIRTRLSVLFFHAIVSISSVLAAENPYVSVSGMGEIKAKPDMAQISIGVTVEDKSSSMALSLNSQKMEKLFKTLKENKIEEKDIQTTNLSVSPKYQYFQKQNRPPTIVGYTASNQVQIKIRDLKLVGPLLDILARNGANEIQGISFSLSEPEKLLDEARKKAMADARLKATLYANSADSKLGKVLGITEQSARMPEPQSYGMESLRYKMADATGAAPPIAGGEQTISAQINVTFKLD
jgi:uncharacterized protein YggE